MNYPQNTSIADTPICNICYQPITDRSKASYLESAIIKGAGGEASSLRLVVHDACISEIADAVKEGERKAAAKVLQKALSDVEKVGSTAQVKQGYGDMTAWYKKESE